MRLLEAWFRGDRDVFVTEARRSIHDLYSPAQLSGVSESAFELTVDYLYDEKLAGRELPPPSVWPTGPWLEVAIEPGADRGLEVSIRYAGIGHTFPSGPLDLVDAWIHLEVVDGRGRVVFESGTEGLTGEPLDPTVRLGGVPVDRSGQPVHRHRVWERADHRDHRAQRARLPSMTDSPRMRL